jgi:hypothetical protein
MSSEIHIGKFQVQSIDDFHRFVPGSDFEMVQLSPRPVKGRMTYAVASNATFSAGSFRGAVRSRGILPSGLTLAVHFGKLGTRASQWDLHAAPGDILLFRQEQNKREAQPGT